MVSCVPALGVAVALPAGGQVLELRPTLDATVLASDRLAVDADGRERGGVLTQWVPGLRLRREGAGLRLDAGIAADAIAASEGEDRARVYPRLDARATGAVVERLLYVDAAANLGQSAVSPLSRRAGGLRADPRLSTFDWRVGPRVDWEWRPGWLLLADAQAAGSRVVQGRAEGGDRPSSLSDSARLRVERVPLPLGAAVALSHQRARDQDRDVTVLKADTARVDLGVSVAEGLTAWAIGGREDVRTETEEHRGSVYGARLRWRPGERTGLDATVLHRFFGRGWQLQFQHRNPWFGLALDSQRDVAGGGTEGLVASGASTALLDTMLSTRHRDPAERRALVRDFARDHPQLLAPVPVYGAEGARARVERRTTATVLLLGARRSAALSLYERRSDPLDAGPATAAALLDAARDERGVAAGISHRLTPLQNVDLRYEQLRTRVEGAGQTRERQVVARWSTKLSPGWSANAGVSWGRWRPEGAAASTERAVFVGLSYAR